MAKICRNKNKAIHLHSHFRDVAQSGLEYASGGRVVAGSNPVIPTIENKALAVMHGPFLCSVC